MKLPVLAKCQKCGREFVTLPEKWPATDPFYAQGVPGWARDDAQPCGGEIVATLLNITTEENHHDDGRRLDQCATASSRR